MSDINQTDVLSSRSTVKLGVQLYNILHKDFGKLSKEARALGLSSLLAPEDMAALEAKTQEVAAKEGDATAQDFNGLIEMLKQLLEKVNVILDPETGLLSPKEGSVPLVAPVAGSVSSTGEGPSTVQETQKKGEGIEAQLEAWDEIVRKFGENAVGAFQNMLESGEIMIYTFIRYFFGPVLRLFGRECTQKPTFQ